MTFNPNLLESIQVKLVKAKVEIFNAQCLTDTDDPTKDERRKSETYCALVDKIDRSLEGVEGALNIVNHLISINNDE